MQCELDLDGMSGTTRWFGVVRVQHDLNLDGVGCRGAMRRGRGGEGCRDLVSEKTNIP